MARGQSKLNELSSEMLKDLIKLGKYSDTELSQVFGISRVHTNQIKLGKHWREQFEETPIDMVLTYQKKYPDIVRSNDFRQYTDKQANKIIITYPDGTKVEL